MLTSRTGTEIEELEKEVARLQEELRVADNRIEELTGQLEMVENDIAIIGFNLLMKANNALNKKK